MQAGFQHRMHIAQGQAETGVAHDEAVLRIEQRKTVLHRLDGVGEVLAGRFSLARRIGQQGVGAVEQGQRLLQFGGAGADLILQPYRALKLGIGGAAVVGGCLDAGHQHLGDAQQLAVLHIGRVGGVDQRVHGFGA